MIFSYPDAYTYIIFLRFFIRIKKNTNTAMKLKIEDEFASRVPAYRVIVLECQIQNGPTSETQKAEMQQLCDKIQSSCAIADINQRPAIAATRTAYKACGKDPNRYRPSQEQLMRRVVRGLGLYNVSSVVDAGNQFSLLTGCSIGCFDRSAIVGDTLTIGIGREDEPYEGIGRGPINVGGLPIVRDAAGGIGTPTSDNERTKTTPSTTHLVATIHIFDPSLDAEEMIATISDLLTRHTGATDIKAQVFQA